MNQFMYKVVWLIHVKEKDAIGQSQGNNRIGMKQYLQPIVECVFVILHECTCTLYVVLYCQTVFESHMSCSKADWSIVLQVFVMLSQRIQGKLNQTHKGVNHPIVIICHKTTFHAPVSNNE